MSDPSVFSQHLSRVDYHFERTRLGAILPHREANWVSARDGHCAKRPGQDTRGADDHHESVALDGAACALPLRR
jgi:hypothetical protein